MWEVFHGPNAIEMNAALDARIAQTGDPTLATLSVTQLDSDAPVSALIAACDTMPFLTETRLVIARSWLSQAGAVKERGKKSTSSKLEAVLSYLPKLPPTTHLIFIEPFTLKSDHPILKLAQASEQAGVHHFAPPADASRWIADRAKVRQCTIHSSAISALLLRLTPPNPKSRDYSEEDSRLWLFKIETELDKLAAFAHHRAIQARDVELLVSDEVTSDIFKFVDAISARNAQLASRELRNLIAQGEAPVVIMGHIARLLRLLVQAKEHAELAPQEFAQRLNLHPFVAQKTLDQARRFEETELLDALQTLLEADVAVKTGELDEGAALDMLIVAMCRAW